MFLRMDAAGEPPVCSTGSCGVPCAREPECGGCGGCGGGGGGEALFAEPPKIIDQSTSGPPLRVLSAELARLRVGGERGSVKRCWCER